MGFLAFVAAQITRYMVASPPTSDSLAATALTQPPAHIAVRIIIALTEIALNAIRHPQESTFGESGR
jgi:hypothetical protein